jgi:Prolyl oligopeptidase family
MHFADDDFQFGSEVTLGACYRQGADIGEVLATAARISDGDADSWLHEWTTQAGSVWSAAVAADHAGRPVSALAHYRRAATYYATALYRVAHGTEPGRQLDIWRRQRACWDRIVDLTGGERIVIGYEGTTLPGYFFRARRAAAGAQDERRPLIVVNNGSDGATSQSWMLGGAAAAERGYHWMTFDGPGQQAALYENGLAFRPDWEKVLTPVLDTVLARGDVDPDRVAVIGVSQAGYWVTRALAFEHRFAAAVVDPGVTDVSTSWTDALSSSMHRRLDDGDQEAFDRELHLGELFTPGLTATLRFRGEPYGHADGSRFELYRTIGEYRLGDEIAAIGTPLLITDPEGEQFWPGQSRQLYDRLTGDRELMEFTAAEGADRHCEPLGSALRETRIFDWLEKYLQPRGPGDESARANVLATSGRAS